MGHATSYSHTASPIHPTSLSPPNPIQVNSPSVMPIPSYFWLSSMLAVVPCSWQKSRMTLGLTKPVYRLRLKADDQMRQRYDAMLHNCPLPRLWGLSLLGTSLCVYAGDVATGELEPVFIDRPSLAVSFPAIFLRGVGTSIFFLKKGSTR
ncbi:hypothetical protein JOM56_000724 [Amanita muscaria]